MHAWWQGESMFVVPAWVAGTVPSSLGDRVSDPAVLAHPSVRLARVFGVLSAWLIVISTAMGIVTGSGWWLLGHGLGAACGFTTAALAYRQLRQRRRYLVGCPSCSSPLPGLYPLTEPCRDPFHREPAA